MIATFFLLIVSKNFRHIRKSFSSQQTNKQQRRYSRNAATIVNQKNSIQVLALSDFRALTKAQLQFQHIFLPALVATDASLAQMKNSKPFIQLESTDPHALPLIFTLIHDFGAKESLANLVPTMRKLFPHSSSQLQHYKNLCLNPFI